MSERAISPAPMGPDDTQVYEYKAWPQWFFREDGVGKIFNSPEEVPDAGWYTRDELDAAFPDAIRPEPPQTKRPKFMPVAAPVVPTAQVEIPGEEPEGEERGEEKPELIKEQPRALTAEQRDELVIKLQDDNSQKDLAAMLELMNEQRAEEKLEELEFNAGWPKLRLATIIADAGGPLES